jgi:hypothetical protein
MCGELLSGFASATRVLTSAADLGLVFRGLAVAVAIPAVRRSFAVAVLVRTFLSPPLFFHSILPGSELFDLAHEATGTFQLAVAPPPELRLVHATPQGVARCRPLFRQR